MKNKEKKNKYPIEIETFTDVSGYYINNLIKKEPSCFNGIVDVQKYRITVERIVETPDVYTERLNKLWAECDNHYHWEPLQNKAKELGVVLVGERGRDSKRNKY